LSRTGRKQKDPEPPRAPRSAKCRLSFPDEEGAAAALADIAGSGTGLCDLAVSTRNGTTTLSGTLEDGTRPESVGSLMMSLDLVARKHRGQFLSIASATERPPETTAR